MTEMILSWAGTVTACLAVVALGAGAVAAWQRQDRLSEENEELRERLREYETGR